MTSNSLMPISSQCPFGKSTYIDNTLTINATTRGSVDSMVLYAELCDYANSTHNHGTIKVSLKQQFYNFTKGSGSTTS